MVLMKEEQSLEQGQENVSQDTNIPTIERDDRVQRAGEVTKTEATPEPQEAKIPDQVRVQETEVKKQEPQPQPQTQPQPQEKATQKPTEVRQSKKEEKPAITTISEFKAAGGKKEQLSDLIENRGAQNIQIFGNRVVAEQDGERFEWTIDKAGNPIKKSLGSLVNEKEQFAKDKGIDFSIDSKGRMTFDPKTLDEALDIYAQFGDKVSISRDSIQSVRGDAVFQKYNKYKGADTETFMDGLKKGEIAVGGETWNRVVRMNGGEATPEMIEAREMFETEMKTTAINNNGRDIANVFGNKDLTTPKTEEDFQKTVRQLDSDYITAQSNIFSNLESMYEQFKTGSESTNELRQKANKTAAKIDELQVEKRKILKNVQKRHSKLPLSAQLKIAQNETEPLNDELFALQRQYNIEQADYQYVDSQDKAEFEFNMKKLEVKQGMIDNIYGVQRGDLIRREDVVRAERKLEEDRAFAEEQRKQAIIDGDAERAKQLSYQIKLMEEEMKINGGIKALGGNAFVVRNPFTGEMEFKTADQLKGTDVVDTTGTTGPIPTGTGTVTQDYGARSPLSVDNVKLADGSTGTPGVDIDGSIGDPVRAFAGGTVKIVDSVKGYGTRVVIEDGQGNLHMYNHLNTVDVKPGDTISRGQQVATMGNTGSVIKGEDGDGSHLDYRVSDNGKLGLRTANWINPNQFISGEVTTQDELFGAASLQEAKDALNLIESPTGLKKIGEKFGEEAGKRIREARNNMVNSIEEWKREDPRIRDLINTYNGNFSASKVSDEERPIIREKFLEALVSRDEARLKDAIRLQVLKGDKGEDLQGGVRLMESLDVINNAFQNLTLEEGQDTGPVLAGLQRANRALGISYTPNTTIVQQGVGAILSDYIKEMSGAAVTDVERQFLAEQLPNLRDNPETFSILLDNFRDKIRRERSSGARTLLRGVSQDEALFNEIFPEFGTIPQRTTTGTGDQRSRWKSRRQGVSSDNPFKDIDF